MEDLQWEIATDDLIDGNRDDNSDGSCDDSEWEHGENEGGGSFGGWSLGGGAVGIFISLSKQGGRLKSKSRSQGRQQRLYKGKPGNIYLLTHLLIQLTYPLVCPLIMLLLTYPLMIPPLQHTLSHHIAIPIVNCHAFIRRVLSTMGRIVGGVGCDVSRGDDRLPVVAYEKWDRG